MVDITVRISGKFKEAIDDVADQLDTSVKSVVDMILQWFFETDWGNPERILEALGDDEDEDEEDGEGPSIGEILGLDVDEDEEEEE